MSRQKLVLILYVTRQVNVGKKSVEKKTIVP